MLKQILEDINKNKKLADTDLSDVHPSILTSVSGDKRRAKENLEELYFTYKNHLKSRVIFVLVNGKSSKKFSEVAAANFNGSIFTGESFYEEIVNKVDTQNYIGRTASSSLVDILSSVLGDKASDIGITGYPALLFKSEQTAFLLNEKKDLVNIFKDMLNEQVGSEFVGLDFLEKVAIESVNSNFSGSVKPIFIHSQDISLLETFAKDFHQRLTPNVFTVTAGIASKEVSEKSLLTVSGKITKTNVGSVLKEIKNSIKL